MKNKTMQERKVSRLFTNRSAIGAAIVSILLIGMVAALSMRPSQAQRTESEKGSANVNRTYATTDEKGNIVMLDRETGQMRGLTKDETRRLAEGLKKMLNQSTEGLVEAHHHDGSESIDLKGRFQNVALATVKADGTVTHACVDNPLAAARFFDIDPKLLGIDAPRVKDSRGFAIGDR